MRALVRLLAALTLGGSALAAQQPYQAQQVLATWPDSLVGSWVFVNPKSDVFNLDLRADRSAEYWRTQQGRRYTSRQAWFLTETPMPPAPAGLKLCVGPNFLDVLCTLFSVRGDTLVRGNGRYVRAQ